MAERFSASAAFTNMNNNNSADGWGDDWGDWNETPSSGSTMTTAAAAGPPKPFGAKQPPPVGPTSTTATNQYFQQQQPPPMHPPSGGQQYFDGPPSVDQHNHNYLPNQSAPQGYPVGASNAGYQQLHPTMVTQQQMYSNVGYNPPQPVYGQANSFFNATPTPPAQQPAPIASPHRPPSHPPASTTPQPVPTFSQTISDSFDTTAGNSWNWNAAEPTTRDTMAPKQPPLAQSYEELPRQTQSYMTAPVQNAHLQQVKEETRSPQWPMESQLSSSDRSPENENNPDPRSSQPPTNAMPSNEERAGVAMGTSVPPPAQSVAGVVENQHPAAFSSYQSAQPTKPPQLPSGYTQAGVPDRLDEVLEALSVVKQEANEPGNMGGLDGSYREQSFPPPPPSIAGASGGPMVNEALHHATKASSTTPPLPPPPVDGGSGPATAQAPPPLPPPTSVAKATGPPPKALQSAGASANPFKRVGGRSHIATPGLAMAPPTSTVDSVVAPTPATNVGAAGAFYYQQQQAQLPTLLQPQPQAAFPPGEEANNVETITPENQEILVESRTAEQHVENHEIAPSTHDRNQYLQTGHLSEDGYGGEVAGSNGRTHPSSLASAQVAGAGAGPNDRRLPPPGLSRYVPGQNQQQPDTSVPPAGQSFPEPPPGLDRMVPGMDLHENASNLSLLERQADGEVSDGTTAGPSALQSPSSASVSTGHASQHYHHGHHHNHERVDMSDRNLYRVPGESDNHHHNQQRVVPGGLENDRVAPVAPASALATATGYGGTITVPVVAPSGSSSAVGLGASVAALDMPEEQRELVMDGENPDDRREEPLVGGNPEPVPAGGVAPPAGTTVETDSNVTIDTSRNVEPSNTSTADESDKDGFYGAAAAGSKGRREDDSLRRSNKSKSSRDRYDTEDSDYSEHERRRRDRESSLGVAGGAGASGAAAAAGGTLADAGSHRHERLRHRTAGGAERDKDKRKESGRGERAGDRDRERERDPRERGDRDYDYRDRDRTRYDRDRERYGRSSKYDRESRYETDGSKYETERSTRYDKDDKRYSSARDDYYRKRDERGPGGDDGRAAGPVAGRDRDRDRDRDGIDRRAQRKEKERSDRYRGEDRRKDDRYREGDKRRDRHDRRYDPEDYRTGSRNGTERDRARDSRERDDRKEKPDRKYLAAGGYGAVAGAVGAGGAYGPASGYYDPYSYYAQHQQYYEQLRRTNPQAYAEWYRTYYSQMQASQLQRDLLTTDGRESVHSGRSSANDKERFNRTTPFMHPPGLYNPEDYHRHYNNQSMPSAAVGGGGGGGVGPGALLDQSYLSDVTGQPASLPPMFHHAQAFQHQQQHQAHSLLHQQQQQQLRASTSLAMARAYQHSDAGGYFQPRMEQIDASITKVDTGTELSMMEPERLTPRKFPEIHPIVSVSAGLLISTKNRLTMNGMADTVKIFSLGYGDASRKLFQAYPGPLVKGVTHKKSVIEFCEEQLRHGPPYSGALALIKSRGNSINSLHSSSLAAGVNRSSFALLWNYIILLLRQNGTFVGTDISELLMQNKTEYPFESLHTSAIRSANISGRNSSLSLAAAERVNVREADARQDGESDREAADATHDALLQQDSKDGTLLVDGGAAAKASLTELEITDKFRDYLLYGNIGEALEWATEHNLWGHALFLASKVDSRQHANVMMKFANKLTLNDPLQTLYQLLSGRTPASVTSVLDEKWGDWRPHLAMLMSNSSAKPELIKKSITTLGDTLYNRGDLYAAHFCYLLSDVAFGRFADVKPDAGGSAGVRLVLLGAAHHHRNFRELSTNESIMMTEIYEYARSLNEDRYSIAELQRYKYLLACRMLDQGMQLKCLLYMEQIAEQIQQDSYRFDTEFVRRVYTLGDRLKYYDPVMEKALDESVDNTGRGNIYANVEDPQWLKRLNEILVSNTSLGASNYNNGSNNEGQQAYDYSSYGHGVDQHAQPAGAVGQEQPPISVYPTETADINKQFNEISQQLGQLNLQYTTPDHQQQYQQGPADGAAVSHLQQPYDTGSGPSYDQGYESINQQHSMMDPAIDQTALQQPQDANSYDPSQQQQQQQFNQYNNYDQQQQPQQTNIFTPGPPPGDNASSAAPGPYDGAYWGAAPGNSEVPKPTISMPNSGANRPGFNDETDGDQSPNANGGMKPPQQNAAQAKKAPAGKDAKGSAVAAGAGGAQGSGWFGGIWNKLSLKPKNQMILPDDKNPKIVWDEATKRWVNTDEGAEAETEAYKPPPKMSDLMPKPAGPAMASSAAPPTPSPMGPAPGGSGPVPLMPTPDQGAGTTFSQNSVPTMGGGASGLPNVPMGEPTKVPTLQSNMYKMQRNRTLKRSYVDVFNPSGAAPSRPTEPVLAPTVPTMATPQGGFFVPAGTPNVGQQTNDAAAGMPQFYNPNEFGGASSYQQ
uniref:Sec16 Sec23-binding domain-containing protein n=1 Tax=Anopheles atroparvus TaxID=41427 RepID=A0AAG5DM81_ANOAO